MSCAPGPPTFRLLDHLVGWDPLDPLGGVYQLTDPDDPGGIRLAPVAGGGPSRSDFLPWLPDPRLAPGCGPCAWYLAASQRGLLRRDPCANAQPVWRSVWPPDCDPGLAAHPHAVAARGHLVAAATAEAVYLWRREGDQLVAVIPGPAAALALAPWGELLLAYDGSTDLSRSDLAGVPRGRIVTGITGRIAALDHRPAAHSRRDPHDLGARRSRRDVAALARRPGQPGTLPAGDADRPGRRGRSDDPDRRHRPGVLPVRTQSRTVTWSPPASPGKASPRSPSPRDRPPCRKKASCSRWRSTAASRAAAGTGCASMPTYRPEAACLWRSPPARSL